MSFDAYIEKNKQALFNYRKNLTRLGNNDITISPRSTINISLSIYYCGSEECQPGFTWGPKLLDHCILYYVYDGQGTLNVSGKEYYIKKGNGFLVPRNALTSFKSDAKLPLKITWVGFYGYLADLYLIRANLTEQSPVFKYDQDDFFYESFRKMIEASKRRFNRYCDMMSLLYGMMSRLLTIAVDSRQYELVDTKELYLRKALEYIDMNYTTKMSIQDLANHVGLDRKYLYSLFKKHLGESPQNYIIKYRVDIAADLLAHTKESVSNIAASVGYDNPFHFSKIFKRMRSISPTEYRQLENVEVEKEKFQSIDNVDELKKILEEKTDTIKELNQKIEELKSVIIHT